MKFIKVLLFILFISNLYAQSPWYIKAGINLSKFRDSDSEALLNYSFGLSRIIYFSDEWSLVPELFITRQGSMLREKPVKTGGWEWFLYSYDIKAVHIYLEIPVLINYQASIKNRKIHFYLGPSYRFVLTDRTELLNQTLIYDDTHPDLKDKYKNYDFEFIQGDYDGFSLFKSPAWSMNFGITAEISVINVELRYTYTFNEMGQIGQIHPIERYLHSLHLLLTYQL